MKYVLDVRKALGDRSDRPTFIETFPRRGYQFVAPVSETSDTSGSLPAAAVTMVGRDAQHARLEACFDDARRGQRRLVLVTGEAGGGEEAPLATVFPPAAALGRGGLAPGDRVAGF